MLRLYYIRQIVFAPLMAGAMIAAAAGPDSDHAKQNLDAVRARIAALVAARADELNQRDAQAARLRNADLALARKREALEGLRAEVQNLEKQRAQLRESRAKSQRRLDAQRAILGEQIRTAYAIGRQGRLKLLLNQQNPASIGRMLTYYDYWSRQQASQIAAIQVELQTIKSLTEALDLQSAQLQALRLQTQRDVGETQAARTEQLAALAALATRVRQDDQQIGRLQRDAQGIEKLLANLTQVLPEYSLGPQRPFAQMRGNLPPPVTGKVVARFHELRGGSHNDTVRWNGIMIDAAHGAKVRAPYYGRVVYADWLQGLGLLIIIEHGGGYMTLFGHSEVLYKKVGDSVAPGDVIATLSDTAVSQLYFEMRQGRVPLDPQSWLKAAR